MDTEAKHTERDCSSAPEAGSEERSRSSRIPDRFAAMSWRRAAALGGVCAVFLLLFSNYVVQPFLIPSGSMESTLHIGDRVLVNKLAYRFGSVPHRGDVVVFDGTGSFVQETPEENPVVALVHGVAASLGLAEPAGTDFVKRVVGVGGDRVVCCDKRGRIEVNGRPVDEEYLHMGDEPSAAPFDIVVPDGKLWMMGDHRSNSRDSRDHLGEPGGGMVPVDRVIGRVDWIGWPLGRLGSLPRTPAFDGIREPGGTHG
ncbi:signal peptidase I [Streptomyces sp. JH14]|uniref:signal peptidase I n=1 Tax=Streptomyces sp. JH14 TaxID=2793630 RepID=UPI0023F85BBC|nr:signal peptidase I [Streptomyces sp. JH14]MDF6045139.1 signal peptidase I [Streptomyces sp. JH14]